MSSSRPLACAALAAVLSSAPLARAERPPAPAPRPDPVAAASARGPMSVALGVLSAVLVTAGVSVFVGSLFTSCPACPDDDFDVAMVGSSVVLLTDGVAVGITAAMLAPSKPPAAGAPRAPLSFNPGGLVLRF